MLAFEMYPLAVSVSYQPSAGLLWFDLSIFVFCIFGRVGSHGYLSFALYQDSFCHCQVRTKLNFKISIQTFQIKFLFLVQSFQKHTGLVYFKDGDEFCHNFSFWALSQFEFLSFVTIWVGHKLSFWGLSHFESLL